MNAREIPVRSRYLAKILDLLRKSPYPRVFAHEDDISLGETSMYFSAVEAIEGSREYFMTVKWYTSTDETGHPDGSLYPLSAEYVAMALSRSPRLRSFGIELRVLHTNG